VNGLQAIILPLGNLQNKIMKAVKISIFFSLIFAVMLVSCNDQQAIIDTNIELDKFNWSYSEKVKIPFTIEQVEKSYNLFLNLRHTSDYRYSNIFLLIQIIDPNGKKTTERKEFKLALPDGEWLGSGSGNLYSYQILFKENFKFTLKGKYTIELEQNMRDNPLDYITDAGIRVERAN
jgi:gliding motility-associated lipoprotein GldH